MRSLLALVLILGACSSPPRERFYTLDAPEPPAAAEGAPSIAVGPVTIPELVDRPQMVARLGANQVQIAEQARWAEPLRGAIARVVAANLATTLGARVAGQRNGDADYRVTLDVQRFDSGPGDAVLIDAAWTVASSKGTRRSGRSVVQERVKVMEYGAVAAAHSAALAKLGGEIAQAIQGLKQ
jgi:uncharacterized lipoprotein YmbA